MIDYSLSAQYILTFFARIQFFHAESQALFFCPLEQRRLSHREGMSHGYMWHRWDWPSCRLTAAPRPTGHHVMP